MCTSFRVKSEDQAVVIGRSMEFAFDLQSKLLIFPRNFAFSGQPLPDTNIKPMSWNGKYGFVGLNGFGQQMLTDGMNEKGLYVGCLYLPGFAKYQDPTAELSGKLLSQIDIAMWILSTFETVEEVKENMSEVAVWGYAFGELGVIPLHLAVHDASGDSIVVEYTEGKLHIYDNPLGVLTNSPSFPWHLINLGNYVNLSATNVPDIKLDGDEVKAIGQGSGMLGLPGDYTPPSRFVRAVAFSQAAIPAKNAEEEVKTAFHILGSFDIPTGLTREKQGDKVGYENTQWMTVSDLTNKIYYYKSYEEPSAIRIKLDSFNFTEDKVQQYDLKTSWFVDLQ